MVLRFSSSPSMALVITDVSIKNDIATSISHIHLTNRPLIKTVYHAAFVTSMEAELFAIKCDINQAVGILHIKQIIIITNLLHTTKRIFDSSSHPYQL